MSETVSVPDVQARWAYSEFVDSPNFAAQYETQQFAFLYRHELDALRAKRQRGVPFSDLTPDDRYWLALMCNSFRIVLCLFFTGIERFSEVWLGKGQLAALIVPPMVLGFVDFVPFQRYMQIPSPAPGDARNVQPPQDGWVAPTDPITVDRRHNDPLLLDGYHRAALFWRYAPGDAQILAYIPEGWEQSL